MARNQSALVNWSQYLALRGVGGLMQSFAVEENLRTAAGVGSLFYRLNGKRRSRAERNIALSFPEWDARRVRETAERSMQHMFQLFMVDALAAGRLITPASWPRYIRLGEIRSVLGRLVHQTPLILVTGHCGNWELLGFALSVIGFPVVALARPLDNPLVDRWLRRMREARGMKILTKWGATTTVQDIIGRGGRVGFIADQNAGERGLFVPFFGRLASSYKSIGLLAMRHRVPIVAGCAARVRGGMAYELNCPDVILPQEWEGREDPLFYITARFNRAIEQMVRAAPEQYLWLHRRWKSRPRHEREGKPIPRRLLAKLRALPWMTSEELDRIVLLSEDQSHAEVV